MGVSVRVLGRAGAGSTGIRRFGGHVDARPATAALAIAVAIAFVAAVLIGDASPWFASWVAWWVAWPTIVAMVPAAAIDIRERRLPDRWVACAAGVLAATTWIAWVAGQPVEIGAFIIGAVAMVAPLLALHLVSPESMGFGDVKAGLVLGAALGSVDWQLAVVALVVAAGLGGAFGLIGRSRTIPFGPFLVLGSAVALAAAPLLGISS